MCRFGRGGPKDKPEARRRAAAPGSAAPPLSRPEPTPAARPPRGAGHHLHLHAILWFDRELTPEELATLNIGLFGRWSRSVDRSLGRECSREAFYIEPVDDALAASDYVAKMCGMPYELTSAVTKQGKGRTIWGVLRDMTLAEEVDPGDVAIWRQYGAAIKGKRGIELSRSMNALLKARPPDEDTADPPEVLATLPRVAYAVIRERRLQAELLEAFRASTSRSDRTAAAELLESIEPNSSPSPEQLVTTALGLLVDREQTS